MHMENNYQGQGLTANDIKIIAIIAMFIDHMAWKYAPGITFIGFIMHMIGRITAPIMCYFVAEGFHYTKNIKKYIKRMCVFAVISHIAYIYYSIGKLPVIIENNQITIVSYTSVIYTLLLGLIALVIWNNVKLDKTIKIILIIIILMASDIGDWGHIAVLWILFFGIYHGNFKKQILSFYIIGILAWLLPILNAAGKSEMMYQLCNFGIYLAVPLLSLYNGKLFKRHNMKWFFYIFYPLHLMIIGLIQP